MGQALHIFKKDVRHLRGEIGLVLVLAALLNWAERKPGAWLAETLFTLAACVLIARLIHGEAIPGTNQFWITRPYRWQSLLWSKLTFVLLFVSVPLMLVQFLLAEHGGIFARHVRSGVVVEPGADSILRGAPDYGHGRHDVGNRGVRVRRVVAVDTGSDQ